MIGDKLSTGNAPSKDDLAHYLFKVLRTWGYGDEASVTFRWTFGQCVLTVILENKNIKPQA
jgi:hypothetical protein